MALPGIRLYEPNLYFTSFIQVSSCLLIGDIELRKLTVSIQSNSSEGTRLIGKSASQGYLL